MGRLRDPLILLVVGASLLAACGDDGETTSSGTEATTSAPTASAQPEAEDRMVEVAGHSVHLRCVGSGEPTVVLEMGAGQTLDAWNSTLPAMADGVRACGYERAGTGGSEPGEEPRTSQVIADELAELLAAADITTPVVLVSHSIGGMHAQAFAQRHPDDVAGMVFIEPRTAAYQVGYRDTLTPAELDADEQELEAVIANEPFGPEVAASDASAAEIVAAGDLPDVPVVVLSADGPQDFWFESHAQLAAQVRDGEQRVDEGAGHEIWRDDQQAVLDAVAEVVASVS